MALHDQILKIVKFNNGIKAREIAKQLDTDKSDVNSILYNKLKGKVYQDNEYKWHAGQESSKEKESDSALNLNTPLARLSKYYLDCLSRDIDAEVSVWASDMYGCPDYGQLPELPLYETDEDLYEGKCIRNAIRNVSKEKQRLNLVLGYPLYLNKFTARNGNTYRKVEPLFLFQYDQDSVTHNGIPTLSDELPQLNSAAFKNITGVSGFETLSEMLILYEELGLEGNEDFPEWDDLFSRLQAIREDWSWKESIDPRELTSTLMSDIAEAGIYNKAGIFPSERSKYTIGLERELRDFIKKNEGEYKGTALGNWINKNLENKESSSYHLIEPLPLNEEQRHVVERSLNEPLTVVTGPPGTGKSQVVTNILVNAVYNEQKVLFASKNHKAVDVVNERVNALSTRPIVLRLGSSNSRSEIGSYLSNLLSATVSQSEQHRYEELVGIDAQLQRDLAKVENKQEEVIECRNTTDELEQKVEEYRDYFGEEIFSSIQNWQDGSIERFKHLVDDAKKAIDQADKNKQPFIDRLLWFFKRDDRFQALENKFDQIKAIENELGIPSQSFQYENIPDEAVLISQHEEELQNVERALRKAEEVRTYFKNLRQLNNLPSLFDLSKEIKSVKEKIQDNSRELWDYWSKLLPERLTQEERSVIGDYATILKMIAKADEEGTKVEKKVWSQYYSMLPKVSGILSAWAVTSLSVRGRVPAEPGFFDLVVIDEASQCDIASALPLLFRAKRAVIIGDPNQLRHITLLKEKEDQRLLDRYDLMEDYLSWSYSNNSLFDLASAISGTEHVVNLKDHHRSHSDIIEFSNEHFYDGSLRIATDYEKLRPIPDEPAVSWKHISGRVEKHPQSGSVNKPEANAVVEELERVLGNGYKGSIGVVTPFRQQANLIRELAHKKAGLSDKLNMRNFLVDTVHKFQGDERDLMIFSPTYSDGIHRGSKIFLQKSKNLFNVAITRARASLMIVGDKVACKDSDVDYLSKFANYVDTLGQEEKREDTRDMGASYPSQYDSPKVSDWEKYFYEKLYESGVRAMPQYQVGQYRLDLAIVSGDRKLDIEIDGERYHRRWDGDLVWRDQLRNMRLIEQGWDVKRFWVYEVRDDLQRCIEEVKSWINS